MIEVPIAMLGGGDARGRARWSIERGLELDGGDLPTAFVAELRRAAAAPMLTPVGLEDDPEVIDGVEWVPVDPGAGRDEALAWLAGLSKHDAVAVWALAVGV